MRKNILITFLTCLFVGSISVFAQTEPSDPLSCPYYIYGVQEVTGRNSSVLRDVQYKGFRTNIPDGGTVLGIRTESEKLMYEFSRIKTTPYIDITGKTLRYWRKLENGEWVTDKESGNGTVSHRSNQDACFLLIVDCSSSLGDSFNQVKQAAKDFISDLYEVSSAGNIHVGIICFSTMDDTKIFPIQPITQSSISNMRSFIESQRNNKKATSMYCAIDRGINDLYDYVEGSNLKKIEGAHIITFTDGLDNTSQLEEKQLYTLNKVRPYVKDRLINTELKGKRLDSWVVGVQGSDVPETQLRMRKSQLSKLASSPDQFFFLTDASELNTTFKKIANGLTKRWQSWVCTSALNHDGPVCWTLGEAPVKPPVTLPRYVPKTKEMLLGVHYGIGFFISTFYESYYDGYNYYEGEIVSTALKTGVGIDAAYPITSNFGVGGYFSIGYPYVSFGALTTIGDYVDNRTAFVGGLGLDVDFYGGTNFDLRGGVIFDNGLYMMLGTSLGDSYSLTFNIGYNFGKFFSVR